MEQLPNGYTLKLAPGAFPLGTDSMVLSGFVQLPKYARVLDLGAGCGTLGMLLCASHPSCAVTGVELDENAHKAALDNIQRNGLTSRLSSICADLRTIPGLFPAGSFSACISNPPYFTGGPASLAHPAARREDCCSMAELFQAAAWALKHGGNFFLVHRPERLAELCAQASASGMAVKRLCLVRHREDSPVSLILAACRKGGKPGVILEEMCLFESDGSPTAQYRKLYHIGG